MNKEVFSSMSTDREVAKGQGDKKKSYTYAERILNIIRSCSEL